MVPPSVVRSLPAFSRGWPHTQLMKPLPRELKTVPVGVPVVAPPAALGIVTISDWGVPSPLYRVLRPGPLSETFISIQASVRAAEMAISLPGGV